jgi:hypothetical protein
VIIHIKYVAARASISAVRISLIELSAKEWTQEATYTWLGPLGTKRAEQVMSATVTTNMTRIGKTEPMVAR